MRLGVNIPNHGPGTDAAVLERWARVSESLGFDLVMVSDHVAITEDVSVPYPAPFHDPFTTLAWLAGRTERIRLGTTVVIMPYRHPVLTAQLGASVHRVSGGRFVFGVGVGWAKQEFAALGLEFKRRGAMTDDYLSALKKLWSGGIVDHHGEFADFEGVHASLSEAETGAGAGAGAAPPIWIGGNGDAGGIRRAVLFGDAWHPIEFTMPWLRAAVTRLAAAAETAGRPVPALAPRIKLRLTEAAASGDDRLTGVGTLNQVVEDLEELRELGADTVLLDTYFDDPQETLRPQRAWRDLAAVIERV